MLTSRYLFIKLIDITHAQDGPCNCLRDAQTFASSVVFCGPEPLLVQLSRAWRLTQHLQASDQLRRGVVGRVDIKYKYCDGTTEAEGGGVHSIAFQSERYDTDVQEHSRGCSPENFRGLCLLRADCARVGLCLTNSLAWVMLQNWIDAGVFLIAPIVGTMW